MSNMIYQVQLDFDEPIRRFDDLKSVFEFLKDNGYIYVYASSDKEYLEKAIEEGVDITKYPVYIKPDVMYGEEMFVESIDFWIKEYMTSTFYNPEHRPHIETFLLKP